MHRVLSLRPRYTGCFVCPQIKITLPEDSPAVVTFMFTCKSVNGDVHKVDYKILLDATVEIGYQLAMSGAETFRIEECIIRIFKAYGISAEVFAIPNCLHVSIQIPDQAPITQMRRVGQHGNDLDTVERYSNLSRQICAEVPSPEIVYQLVTDAKNNARKYPLYFMLIGHFLGAFGFAILFGGNWIDAICGGLCGIVIALINLIMDHLHANLFFKIISSSIMVYPRRLDIVPCAIQ